MQAAACANTAIIHRQYRRCQLSPLPRRTRCAHRLKASLTINTLHLKALQPRPSACWPRWLAQARRRACRPRRVLHASTQKPPSPPLTVHAQKNACCLHSCAEYGLPCPQIRYGSQPHRLGLQYAGHGLARRGDGGPHARWRRHRRREVPHRYCPPCRSRLGPRAGVHGRRKVRRRQRERDGRCGARGKRDALEAPALHHAMGHRCPALCHTHCQVPNALMSWSPPTARRYSSTSAAIVW